MIPSAMPNTLSVRTPTLEIAYEAHGREGGVPVVLLHGFPDDPRAFDAVAPPLASAGYRVLVPYLRGYGPTRFLDAAEPRMAQQAAIGQDLLDFMDALGIPGARVLVPVVLQHRARPRGPREEPARALQAALAGVVSDVEVRRRRVRAHGAVVRQAGLRAGRHPLLPSAARPRGRRPAPSRSGTTAGRAAP